MKIYWQKGRMEKGPAKICEDIAKQGALPWKDTNPESEILVGRGMVFIQPSEYKINGYSLTVKDLEDLLEKTRGSINHSLGLCGKPNKPDDYSRALLATHPAHCLCCGSMMKDENCGSLGMQQLDMYKLVCPTCPPTQAKA